MSLWHGLPPPPKFPFWSAIIKQTQGSISVPSGSTTYVDIQPPPNETWLVWIDWSLYNIGVGYQLTIMYFDYDGTTRRCHKDRFREGTDNPNYGHLVRYETLGTMKVLTNSLYGSVAFYQNTGDAHTGVYGYSGFKLSEPLWTPKRFNNPSIPAWKRELQTSLPSRIKSLSSYACEVFDHRLNDYIPAIMLEENTPLAVDPRTNFPIERLTVITPVENLLNILEARDNPDKRPSRIIQTGKYKGANLRDLSAEEYEEATGYKKYFDKWRSEGISI